MLYGPGMGPSASTSTAPQPWVRRLFAVGAGAAAAAAIVLATVAVERGHDSVGLAAMMLFLAAALFTGVARPGPGQRLTRRYAGRYVIPSELDSPASLYEAIAAGQTLG
ncbi:hypothetical protein ACFLIM_40770 [Nonomuraea sp. M3C6]|uniref:Uncharacterized protein n=1 Tax=Nonomuraea marmarensis TaxID=3351344 RepID=A0ABW7AQ64_9ACTN